MAENLNYGAMVVSATDQVNDGVVEKFCYSDAVANCTTDGGLYTWAEAMALPSKCNFTTCATQISTGHHQGICPTGWHIPKAVDWNTLATYLGGSLGGSTIAGKKIKLSATGFTSWDDTTNNDGNSSGFSAFPAGFRYYNGFDSRGNYASFWEATEYNSITEYSVASKKADYIYLSSGNSNMYSFHLSNKDSGFSVRCLKD